MQHGDARAAARSFEIRDNLDLVAYTYIGRCVRDP